MEEIKFIEKDWKGKQKGEVKVGLLIGTYGHELCRYSVLSDGKIREIFDDVIIEIGGHIINGN